MDIVVSEQRLIDGWWSEKIASVIKELPYTATDTASDVSPGSDFGKTIKGIVNSYESSLQEVFHESFAFEHKADHESAGAGIVFEGGFGSTLVVECYHDIAMARAWGRSLPECERLTKDIISKFPKKHKPIVREDLIPVAFWHANGSEAACYVKDVKCPSFDEIKGNYSKKVYEELNWLQKLSDPDELGKIILWHGVPGSGKTHSVRALAREWLNTLDATVEVILDPEMMLGSAGYMRSVLLSDERASRARKAVKARKHSLKDADSEKQPLRLIIVEDSAELFSTDCRSTPGFSRLLNLTDGIIGQGLRCIFLMTANEEIGKIDPAIVRAGRCIQNLHFSTFSKSEGKLWLKNNGCPDKEIDSEEVSLADLYAIKHERHEREPATKFGF